MRHGFRKWKDAWRFVELLPNCYDAFLIFQNLSELLISYPETEFAPKIVGIIYLLFYKVGNSPNGLSITIGSPSSAVLT